MVTPFRTLYSTVDPLLSHLVYVRVKMDIFIHNLILIQLSLNPKVAVYVLYQINSLAEKDTTTKPSDIGVLCNYWEN
jgi:hypothetical protein